MTCDPDDRDGIEVVRQDGKVVWFVQYSHDGRMRDRVVAGMVSHWGDRYVIRDTRDGSAG